MRPINRRFFSLSHVGNQASKDINEKVDGTTMPGMLNLRNILQLVIHGFNNCPFSQQQFFLQKQKAIFHIFTDVGDEFDALFQQSFKECLRQVTSVTKQLPKQASDQFGNWFTVINVSGCEREG